MDLGPTRLLRRRRFIVKAIYIRMMLDLKEHNATVLTSDRDPRVSRLVCHLDIGALDIQGRNLADTSNMIAWEVMDL